VRSTWAAQFATSKEAAEFLILSLAAKIVAGRILPHEGAKAIWQIKLQVDDSAIPAASPFIYAASEYEDRPDDRAFFSAEILREARNLID
jgi:hypothetical protein